MKENIRNIKDQVGLIWLTMVGYIIFIKDSMYFTHYLCYNISNTH